MKTVQYSSQRRGTPNLHLLSHPLTLRRCNLSNESNCIVCRDTPLEFLNLPWCPSPVTGIAVVPSLTQTFPRQELQCPMTNKIRPLHTVITTTTTSSRLGYDCLVDHSDHFETVCNLLRAYVYVIFWSTRLTYANRHLSGLSVMIAATLMYTTF